MHFTFASKHILVLCNSFTKTPGSTPKQMTEDNGKTHNLKSLSELTTLVDEFMEDSEASTFYECLTESLDAYDNVSMIFSVIKLIELTLTSIVQKGSRK